MEEVYKELEEVKSAMEKLTAEYRAKSDLSDSLRKAYDEQLAKLQEAKGEIVKQTQELEAKSEEISLAKQMYEDLKSNLCEKESVLKHLTSVNNKLRTNSGEKMMKLEVANRQLISALDEAHVKIETQDEKMGAYREEIKGLKGLLSESQKKCSDAEERAQAAKELRKREEILLKLEQEKERIGEQLKWKSEQFRHLKEAHKKHQDEFLAGKKEWDSEKSTLVDEICSLQANLESQTRVVEDLRSRLRMCNQALAHEESRRKLLEIQMSESKACYDNVVVEYEEARSKIGALTAKRDEDIATLRNLLATRETLFKEMEFRTTHLELENQELRGSLKEFQEAQINEVGAAASLKTLHQKYRLLEQAHRDCPEKLKAKKAEWIAQTEKLEKDLSECLSKVSSKDKQLLKLQVELEGSHSLIMQQKLEIEEISVVLMVLKSKLLEVCSDLESSRLEIELCSAKAEERLALMMEQLEKKNSSLVQAQAEIVLEHGNVESLQTRIGYLEFIEQEYLSMQKELNMYKEMLEESSRHLDHLKEQTSQNETGLQEDLRKTSDAFDRANFALTEKTREMGKVEFELQHLKSSVERMEKLKSELVIELSNKCDESNSVRRDLEVSFLAKLKTEKTLEEEREKFLRITEEKDKKIKEFQQEIVMLDENFSRRELEAATLAKRETRKIFEDKSLQIGEEKDRPEGTHTDCSSPEQEYVMTENEATITLEQERANFLEIVKEKENVIADLQQQILLLEQEFTRSVETAVTLELADKQLEIDTLCEVLEESVATNILDTQEIQYKNTLLAELEEEIVIIQLKLELEEKLSTGSNKRLNQLEAESTVARLEREKEKVQVEEKFESMQCNKRTLEDQIEGLKAYIKSGHETIKQLSLEREGLVGQTRELCDLLEEFHKDEELMRSWKRVVQKARNEEEREEIFSSNKVDGRDPISPSGNKAGQIPDRRLPLKEHNC